MDSARKRPAGGEGAEEEGEEVRTRTRLRGSDDRGEVKDEEVEEFFAILRQMRDVARFFASRDGSAAAVSGGRSGAGATERENGARQGAWRWRPTFVREDFEDQTAGGPPEPQRRRKRSRDAADAAEEEEEEEEEAVEMAENGIRRRVLDLNAEPGTQVSHP